MTTFATGGASRLHHLRDHGCHDSIKHGHSESTTVPASRPKKQISPIYIYNIYILAYIHRIHEISCTNLAIVVYVFHSITMFEPQFFLVSNKPTRCPTLFGPCWLVMIHPIRSHEYPRKSPILLVKKGISNKILRFQGYSLDLLSGNLT